jgi:thiol:disulfide interchange protein DsbG
MALTRRSFLSLIPLALAQAACAKVGQDGAADQTEAWSATGEPLDGRHVSMAALQSSKGFAVGNLHAARTVYVMFDPQCPHCGRVWGYTKALWPQARFVWIPVGLMNNTSVQQGVALLQAGTAAQMDLHEERLAANLGGLAVDPSVHPPLDLMTAVEKNGRVLASFGAERVPFLVSVNEKTGKPVVIEGEVHADVLIQRFGWRETAGAA